MIRGYCGPATDLIHETSTRKQQRFGSETLAAIHHHFSWSSMVPKDGGRWSREVRKDGTVAGVSVGRMIALRIDTSTTLFSRDNRLTFP
jgi:hypothetical protein